MAKRNSSNTPDRDGEVRSTNEDDYGRYGAQGGDDGWQRDPVRQPEVAQGERSEGYRGGEGNRYEEDEKNDRPSGARQGNDQGSSQRR